MMHRIVFCFTAVLTLGALARPLDGQANTGNGNPAAEVDANVFRELSVDERPERKSGRPLRYPAMLLRARVEGYVLAEFVIDTVGRVEKNSIEILVSTNRAFEGAAKDFIGSSRFEPGRIDGRPVRVLVQQQINFRYTS